MSFSVEAETDTSTSLRLFTSRCSPTGRSLRLGHSSGACFYAQEKRDTIVGHPDHTPADVGASDVGKLHKALWWNSTKISVSGDELRRGLVSCGVEVVAASAATRDPLRGWCTVTISSLLDPVKKCSRWRRWAKRRRGVLRFRAGSVNCVQRSQLARARWIQSELGDLGSRCAVVVRCFPLPGRHRSLAAPWSQHRVETCGIDGSVVARSHLGHEVDIVKSTPQGKCRRRVHHSST